MKDKRKTKLSLFLFILAFAFTVKAQDKQTVNTTPIKPGFLQYVEQIEANSNYHFYFNRDIVKEIDISTITPQNITRELEPLLKKYELRAYFDGNDVYIYKGAPITIVLPDYEKISSSPQTIAPGQSGITQTEKKYKEGKALVASPVLIIGNKNNLAEDPSCIINGKISDINTGEPLVGATIYVPSLEAGALTDVDGRFKIVLSPGKYEVKINHISMKEQEFVFQVYSSGNINIEMEKEFIAINEAVISATHNDNVRGIQMGYEKISAKSMKEIPVVMGEKDVLKVAQMLPGVENMGEGTSGFNVRGSPADQNMFYINKIPVYNTSHLLGFFTAFSPDIIRDFTLYKSNIPARYGGRLASVFDITTRQGNKKQFFGHGGISPVTAHFSAEGPLIKDKVSVVASYRGTYSDWILKQVKTLDINKSHAFFYDASLGFNIEVNDKNLVKLFAYGSNDDLSLSDKNDYNYNNTGASASWKHLFSNSLTGDFAIVYSSYKFNNTDKYNPSESYLQKYGIGQYEIKGDFNLITANNHRLEFGASSTFYHINRGTVEPYGDESTRIPVDLGMDNGIETAFYVSDKFRLLPRLNLLTGIRYSFFAEMGGKDVYSYLDDAKLKENIIDTTHYTNGQIAKFYSGPEFRIALNYGLTGSTSVKTSYNRTRQYIFMLSNTVAISPSDQWKLVGRNITPPLADQVTIGLYQNITPKGIEASVEAYYKKIRNIVEYKDGADFISPGPIEWQILQGDMATRGLEFMVRKKSGKLTGWVSYARSSSIIRVASDNSDNEINYGKKYPSNYDRPHSLNIVTNYRFNRRVSISNNFVYTTGRPVTLMIGTYYSEGEQLPLFSERNEYRIPDYIRWDLSVNVEGNLLNKKIGHSYWMLNVYNVLGRKNVYSIFPDNQDGELKYYQLSIFAQPIITLSWNFKFGNYLSE